ncbi:lipoprotein NlpI [Volucribacter amazonae]|uniref:Lipoprotein NlpI n=1 Tax=Volucribacter amazonae TaxID=256731 RepID=A0A9X4PEC4_9PAST|nr:lipoprotein NlpI [Volucribacter amazonae]MDG6896109.1 lipoprotein NlpI-like protein [Volucribacter amazonae]
MKILGKQCKRFGLSVFLSNFFISLLLMGCVAQDNFGFTQQGMLLAQQTPEQHSEQEEMLLRLNQILLIAPLNTEERADLHFERGVIYDSLGLWKLASYDFALSLRLQPGMAPAYNYLGLYFLLQQDYDEALEAFNAVLTLQPNYEYAYLNRGLHFYYTERYHLAQQDFERFYQYDPSDPYRALWLYFNEVKLDPRQAIVNLGERANSLSPDYWGTQIVDYFVGKISLNQLLQKIAEIDQQSVSYAEVLTETYFYLAKQQLNTNHIDEAMRLFKLAVANQVYNFVEYRFALFELSQWRDNDKQGAVAQ